MCPRRLAEQEIECAIAAFLHVPGDVFVNPYNVPVNGTAHVVDRAWPTREDAWIDPACLILMSSC